MTEQWENDAAWMIDYAERLSQRYGGRPAPGGAVAALRQIAAKGMATKEEVLQILATMPELMEGKPRLMLEVGRGPLTLDVFQRYFRRIDDVTGDHQR